MINFVIVFAERPLASVQLDSLVVTDGDSASFVCTVTGVPLPDVTWRDRHNHAILNGGDGMSLLLLEWTHLQTCLHLEWITYSVVYVW